MLNHPFDCSQPLDHTHILLVRPLLLYFSDCVQEFVGVVDLLLEKPFETSYVICLRDPLLNRHEILR